jgi:hypothetical protein
MTETETSESQKPAPVALQPVVRHHDEATMKTMLTDAASWYDPASGEVVVRAARMKAMEQALNEILECSNGHFNPLFKCKCYDKAHALVMPNAAGEPQPPTTKKETNAN